MLRAVTEPYQMVRIMRLCREQILSCQLNEIWARVLCPEVEDLEEDRDTY